MSRRYPHGPPPPEPEPTADEIAERRALASAAREAGVALARAVDLAKLVGGKPDGYTVDELAALAATLRGWGLSTAIGAGAMDLVQDWTGRAFTEIKGVEGEDGILDYLAKHDPSGTGRDNGEEGDDGR